MPPKVIVSVPRSLKTTTSERAKLKGAFKAKIRSIVKPHGSPQNPVTNTGGIVTEIVVTGSVRKPGSKRKVGKKKAGKKK